MLNTKIGYLALFSALFISSIAIYFSVVGLAAIFSGAPLFIIAMGTSIELGKLAGVIWLHYNWKDKSRALVRGMTGFVIGVMFITSIGIFGFLSRAHIEQTALSQENMAQVQRIDTEIARNTAIIARAEQKIRNYEDNGSGVDASLNAQIDKEQARIDSAYERVKPVIQVQLDIIAAEEEKNNARTKPFQEELNAINTQLADLQAALNNKEIRKVSVASSGNMAQRKIRSLRLTSERRLNNIGSSVD